MTMLHHAAHLAALHDKRVVRYEVPLAADHGTVGTVGEAPATLVDAPAIVDFAVAGLEAAVTGAVTGAPRPNAEHDRHDRHNRHATKE